MHTLSQLQAGELLGITRLDLSCGLTEFPPEIFALADSLEVLNLSGNRLSSLPDDLWRLHQLKIIFCSDNCFTELPAVLGRCTSLTMIGFKANQIQYVPEDALPPALRWLILTDNRLRELPASIGRCTQMQKLMLAGNQLSHLPPEMAACQSIELLRLSANRFVDLPDCLLELPKLAWLALAGNPLNAEQEALAAQQVTLTPWSTLSIGERLGEGASGTIYRAQWQIAQGVVDDVAVKLFKGDVTSDGLPQSEMAATLAAGSHANLIGVCGVVSEHPEQRQGLVLPLMSSHLKTLAQPPCLASCTRDVYSADVQFTVPVSLAIAKGIALAALHLHARGLIHGDLYAHNILYDVTGLAILGDLGAASFLPQNKTQSLALQRIEVRAIGLLLGELIERSIERHADLESLHAACLSDERPTMLGVATELQRISQALIVIPA